MAVFDAERDAVVIRIVYDGPPYAGKTTSVRSLARSLTRDVETPLESAGRTVYFDWMEYTGGLFEGHQIRCQIVSVPGQPDLVARRQALLETADVVVFVADTSTHEAVARSVGHVRQLAAILRAHDGPPIGVIVQANKRDVSGAVPRDEVRAVLGEDFTRIALTESIADTGVGIRETFVLAVRIALDRARELIARGELPQGRPAVDSAEQLLTALESAAQPFGRAAARARIPAAPAASDSSSVLEDAPVAPAPAGDIASALMSLVTPPQPRLPDVRVPSGAIWPPVEGRMVLHEVTDAGLSVRRVGDGDWIAGIGSSWRIHSAAAAVFHRFDDGKQALLTWARAHAAHAGLLSPTRCIVLAEASPNTWRLWQIVKLMPSLRTWLIASAALAESELAERLATAAAALGEAHARCAESWLLPTLDNVGRDVHGPQLVALMPAALPAAQPRPSDVPGQIARELSRLLSRELAARRPGLVRWIAQDQPARTPWDEIVRTALADHQPPRIASASWPGFKP